MKTGFFTTVPQCCFLFNEWQSQNEATLHNPILSAPLFAVTSHGKREPTGDKVHNVRVAIIFGGIFFTIPNRQNMLFPHELQQMCINST